MNYLIAFIIFIGLAVLFFFPEPESNFFAYLGTALLFIALITVIKVLQRRRRKR